MKSALIIGGSGLVGKQLVELLIGDKRYNKIILLVRRPMDKIHIKLEQVVFDFDKPDASILQADDLFCCLGTTIRSAGSKKEFYKVDFDYILSLARLSYTNGTKRIALVSSMGADKKSLLFYNKTKGEAEEAVSKIGFESCFILRPSLLLGYRSEFRMGESIAKFFMETFSFALSKKHKPVRSELVAKAMVDLMNSGEKGVRIVESDFIQDNMLK